MRVLRLETGEELIESLTRLAARANLNGAWFWAIGATDDATVAFYDLAKRKYVERRFRGRMEIIGITGNISRKRKETVIHAHGIFGKPNYSTIGGHVVSCRISATCELYLQKTVPLKRRPDPKTGLNFLMR